MSQAEQFFTSLGFGVAFFVFLTLAFFFAKRLESGQHLILKIMTSLFGAITAGLFTGAATLNFTEKFRGQELTVGGVAGFVVFLLVWLRFPKREVEVGRMPDPTDINFHVPEGWTLRQVLDTIGKLTHSTVDYGDLYDKELSAPLKDFEIHARNAEIAIKKVRDITTVPEAVRAYDVQAADSTYYLKVRK